MKNFLFYNIFITFLLIMSFRGEALDMVNPEGSNYEIITSTDAIPAEKTAAKQLQLYLREITGVTLPINTVQHNAVNQILIGQSNEVKALLPDINFDALKADEIIIRTVGKCLVISGGRPRGTLYAVYTFLEDQLGVQWWTSQASTIPCKRKISLPELNIRYAPAIEVREAFYSDIINHPDFAVKLKNNGHYIRADKKLGGHCKTLGFVHTFDQFIPAKKYLKTKPEWFSLVGGKRIGGLHIGQLCLSNKEMRLKFTEAVLDKLRKTPSIQSVSVSQNDNKNYCHCHECKKIDAAEGSHSGSLIHFVNQIAEAVEKEFPDVNVETLAYQYSQKPPAHIRPRHNVIVRLCSIEADFSKPLNSSSNKSFYDSVIGWSKITPKLAIWNYTANFSQYLQPHPNWVNLANDIRFFATHNTVALFEHGDRGSGEFVGDFVALRVWLLSKLMWNPDLDQKKLTEEFLTGYYGAAAPFLKEYLDLMENAIQRSNHRLTCYETDTANWLSLDTLNKATKILTQAENAVKSNAILHERVQRVRFSLDSVWASRGKYLKDLALRQNKTYEGPGNQDKFIEKFIHDCKRFRVENYAEGKFIKKYIALLKKRNASTLNSFLPPDLQGKNVECHVFDVDEFRLFRTGKYCFVTTDKASHNGKVVRIPCNHQQWVVQCTPSADIIRNQSWRVFLRARGDSDVPNGMALKFGIYDTINKKNILTKTIMAKDIVAKDYDLFELGTVKLQLGMFIWMCPFNNPGMKNLWVKSIIIAAVQK